MVGEMATSTVGLGSVATACWASDCNRVSSVVRIGGVSRGGVEVSCSVGWPWFGPAVATSVTDQPAEASIAFCHSACRPSMAGEDRLRSAVSNAPCSSTVTPGSWASWSRTPARSSWRSLTAVTVSSLVPANCAVIESAVMVGSNGCSSAASGAADS